ncbi:hypothetical protein [Micromonospora okii]|uniref:hypothetical protein n=1 Tax=Micromonospora okii TaxID=1182970 RepID=UPI001E65785A|nr:hypothetical protein [Micromonospora okii]
MLRTNRLARRHRRWLLPAGRTASVWAALAAVVCGLSTAALATRATWETARPQPTRAEVVATRAALFPGQHFDDVQLAEAHLTFYSRPLGLRNIDNLLFGDGGEYQQAEVSASAAGVPPTTPDRTLAALDGRLREGGWRLVYGPTRRTDPTCAGTRCAAVHEITTVVARRADTVLDVEVRSQPAPADLSRSHLSATMRRGTPPGVVPAAIVAGLLGAGLGWLVVGWASRRTAADHPARGVVTALFTTTLLAWWAPVALSAPALSRHHLREPHPTWHPVWEWLGQPALLLFFTVGLVCAVLALALAASPRRRPAPLPAAPGATPAR